MCFGDILAVFKMVVATSSCWVWCSKHWSGQVYFLMWPVFHHACLIQNIKSQIQCVTCAGNVWVQLGNQAKRVMFIHFSGSETVWNILKPPATDVNLSGASDLCWCCLLPGPIFAIAPGQPHHAKEKEPGHCGGIKLLWLALQSSLKAWELGSSHPYTSGYMIL